MKKTEFSKKIMVFSGVIFFVAVIYSMIICAFALITQQYIEWTPIVTLLTVTGTAFSAAAAFYYTKAKRENSIKLQKWIIEYKYKLFKDLGIMTTDRFIQDLEQDFGRIDQDFETQKQEDDNQTDNSFCGGVM